MSSGADARARQAEVPAAAEVAFLRGDRRSLRDAVREADDHALDRRLSAAARVRAARREDADATIDRQAQLDQAGFVRAIANGSVCRDVATPKGVRLRNDEDVRVVPDRCGGRIASDPVT